MLQLFPAVAVSGVSEIPETQSADLETMDIALGAALASQTRGGGRRIDSSLTCYHANIANDIN